VRLTTERLELRPFDRDRDWPDFLSGLVLDPVVTRYWADFADPDLSDADRERLARDEFLPWFEEGLERGLVVWTVRTPGGDFVGVSGLMTAEPPVGGPDPEFGTLLASRWHGRGLATEAGRAVMADAWARLPVDRVIIVLDSPNPASRHLTDKLGFRLDGAVFDDAGMPYLRFVADRQTISPLDVGAAQVHAKIGAMSVPPIPTPRFELVSMSLGFMRLLLARDLPRAEAEIGAVIPAEMPARLDAFLQFRIADLSVDPAAQPWLGRAIVLTGPDGMRRIIGSCGFHAPPGPDGRVEVGYRVEPEYRRQGVATEAVHALFDWAHGQGVDRFRASVAPGNVASLAIVGRLGFRQVGVQMDDIDGEEFVFELDGWPPAG